MIKMAAIALTLVLATIEAIDVGDHHRLVNSIQIREALRFLIQNRRIPDSTGRENNPAIIVLDDAFFLDSVHTYRIDSFFLEADSARGPNPASGKQCRGLHGTSILALFSSLLEPDGNSIGICLAPFPIAKPNGECPQEKKILEVLKDLENVDWKVGPSTRIVNISMELVAFNNFESDLADTIFRAMNALKERYLFVVSAGNDNGIFDRPGKGLPENLLFAGGLDSSGSQVWKTALLGSRAGSGIEIFSSAGPHEIIIGGEPLQLTGTSESAAVVSAAAALMLAANGTMKPREIKEILLKTSDAIQIGSKWRIRRLNALEAATEAYRVAGEGNEGL